MLISREFWLQIRQALLMVVDAIEKLLCIEPSTADLRKESKEKMC